jgi:prepilin peptidase CpaA
MHTPPLHLVTWSLLALTLGVVAVVDARQRRIPNSLVALIAVGGFLHALAVGGVAGGGAAIVGAVSGVALLFLQFARGWMGAGDVKLLGALGLWCGWLGAVWVLVLGSLVGGVLSVWALARLGSLERVEVGGNVLNFARAGALVVPAPADRLRRGVPFGVALALAGAAVTLLGLGR